LEISCIGAVYAMKPGVRHHFPVPDYIVQGCAMQGMAAKLAWLVIKVAKVAQIRPRIENP